MDSPMERVKPMPKLLLTTRLTERQMRFIDAGAARLGISRGDFVRRTFDVAIDGERRE